MSRYVNIPLPEFQNFLKQEKGWREEIQSREVVFSFPLKNYPDIEIKVYSGIDAISRQSRRCGGDAIRVCAVHTKKHLGWIKSARVYRCEGWRNNLKERVFETIKRANGRARQQGT